MQLKTVITRPRMVAIGATLAFAIVALIIPVERRDRFDALLRSDPNQVPSQPNLARTAREIGRPAFTRLCAGCHGGDGTGNPLRSAPALTGSDHIYGSGKPEEIEQIVLYGIRAGPTRGKNLASMPAFARETPYAGDAIPPLLPADIADVTQFVLSLSGRETDRDSADRGRALYAGKGACYDCHGGDGRGDPAIGAPNLADSVWLYGDGSEHAISQSISYGRAGICPAFSHRVTPLEARAIAIYVASLSHGEQGKRRGPQNPS